MQLERLVLVLLLLQTLLVGSHGLLQCLLVLVQALGRRPVALVHAVELGEGALDFLKMRHPHINIGLDG